MGDIHQQKILSIQALRAIAFLGIFTAHSGLTELGAWGVSVFFVLSGFVMFYTHGYENIKPSFENSIRFSLSKIKKLYPLHVIMMLAAMVFMIYELIVNYSIKNMLMDTLKVLLNIFLLQTWVPQTEVFTSLNGVSWYLSSCLFIYCLFPYLAGKISRYKKISTAIRSILVIFFIQFMFAFITSEIAIPTLISDNFSKWFTYICPLFRSGDFAIGCCIGYIIKNTKLSIDSRRASVLEIVTITFIVICQIMFKEKIGLGEAQWFRYTLLYTPSSIFLVLLFAVNKGVISQICTNKVTIALGNLSTFTFLIHIMVIQYIKFIDGLITIVTLNTVELALVTLILTIGLAELWKIMNRRFIFFSSK